MTEHAAASSVAHDDDRLALAGLAALPSLGPIGLASMLRHHQPVDLWQRLRSGRPLHREAVERRQARTLERLRSEAAVTDPQRVMLACEAVGARVAIPSDPDFPPLLAADSEPSSVLFVRGDLALARTRRVGIVGTRNATAAGRATAFELGAELARHGVAVVSGLARGIDGAAHRGVRDAGGSPIAVVGSGVDVPYPRQHRDLWEWVAAHGLLLSEWPPGVQPDAWHFPVRNRIVAALSEVLVVVESRERGGSLITADAARNRDITVMAVPGSPQCRASKGTNELLSDEATVMVTCADDVLVALGLDTRRATGEVPLTFRPAAPPEHTLEARVFRRCAEAPCTLADLVTALGVSISEAALAVARLERDGWIVDSGGWLEPSRSRLEGS